MFNPISYLKTVASDVIGCDSQYEKQIAKTLTNKNVLKNLTQSVFIRPMAGLEAVYADLVKSLGTPNVSGQALPTDIRSFLEANSNDQLLMLLHASSNKSGTDPILSNAAPSGPLKSMEPGTFPQPPNIKSIPKAELEPYCKVRATAAIQPIASPFLALPELSPMLPLPVGASPPIGNKLAAPDSSAASTPLSVPDMTIFPYPSTLSMLPQLNPFSPSPLFQTPDYMSWFLATGLIPMLLQMPVPVSQTAPVPEPVHDPPRAKRRRVEKTSVPVGSEIPMPVGSPMPKIPSKQARLTPAPSTASNIPQAPIVKLQESSGSPLQMLEKMIPRNVVPPNSVSELGYSSQFLIFEELLKQMKEGNCPQLNINKQ